MRAPILTLRNVYVSRGGYPVLHNIHLDLKAGEHLAILGPNGCGKSTLLKTITCELYPLATTPDGQRPSVSIFGRARWDLTLLRQRLGLVSADPPARPALHTSGFDSILTGFFSSSTLWPNLIVTASMRARAEDLLHQVGAEGLRRKLVGHMSAGQQRRIMIARALAGSRAASRTYPSLNFAPTFVSAPTPCISPTLVSPSTSVAPFQTVPDVPLASPPQAQSQQPSPEPGQQPSQDPDQHQSMDCEEMLLMDEPSNALDIGAQTDLRNLLRDLAGQGTALLLITHHTADIIPEIDRVLLINQGRITGDGPKQDLLTASSLSSLFRTNVNLTERDGFYHTW